MTPMMLMLAVLMNATAAGLATYFLNASKERILFLGRKFEELYCTVEALDCELSYFYAKYSLVGDTQQVAGREGLHRASAYFATSQMLVGLYFPTLLHHLARARAAAATAERSLGSLERGASESGRMALAEALDDSVCDLKDALDALKAAILAKGRVANNRKIFALSWRSPEATSERRVLRVHA